EGWIRSLSDEAVRFSRTAKPSRRPQVGSVGEIADGRTHQSRGYDRPRLLFAKKNASARRRRRSPTTNHSLVAIHFVHFHQRDPGAAISTSHDGCVSTGLQ